METKRQQLRLQQWEEIGYNSTLRVKGNSAGAEILESIGYLLSGFASLYREAGADDFEMTGYVSQMERALPALTTWAGGIGDRLKDIKWGYG